MKGVEKKIDRPARQSGVELLKVIGILFVILSHVVQTLVETKDVSWSIDLETGITNPTTFAIAFLRYAGMLGNTIFITCSAWYLLDKDKTDLQKVMRMLLDILVISILWFIPIAIWKQGTLTQTDIVSSFFPTCFSNNWYTTSYILFCFIYPLLNWGIRHVSRWMHAFAAFTLFIAFFVVGFLATSSISPVCLVWVVLHLVVAYFRLYKPNVCESTSINCLALTIGIGLHIGSLFVANNLCLQGWPITITAWNVKNNPFFFLIAFSGLNLMRKTRFQNKAINYLSGLSMLIYVIHENILFRNYVRTLIWEWIYLNAGYDLIILWIFAFVISLFLAALGVAVLYRIGLQKPVHRFGDFIAQQILKLIRRFANKRAIAN